MKMIISKNYKKAQFEMDMNRYETEGMMGEKLEEPTQITPNPLDGKSKKSAKNYLYKLVEPYTKGIYSDSYWQPIQAIWKSFTDNNLEWEMTRSSQYFKDEKGNPIRKEWYFKISFLNNRQRLTEIVGTITAAGAGTVQDPLDRYDVVVVMF